MFVAWLAVMRSMGGKGVLVVIVFGGGFRYGVGFTVMGEALAVVCIP